MPLSLLDLPNEVLMRILRFESLITYETLLKTNKRFHQLIGELVLCIGDFYGEARAYEELRYASMTNIAPETLELLTRKYDYFIIDIGLPYACPATIAHLKTLLRHLVSHKRYHTITIRSTNNHDENYILRSLLPKFNTRYTEFHFPSTQHIRGTEDLRILDNTRCYFPRLETMTIGSLSFQLFDCTAPQLRHLRFSEHIVNQALYTLNCRKLCYSGFLKSLLKNGAKLQSLVVLGHVERDVLKGFSALEWLVVHGDHLLDAFDVACFPHLRFLSLRMCESLAEVSGEEALEYPLDLGLTQNKARRQRITSATHANRARSLLPEVSVLPLTTMQCT